MLRMEKITCSKQDTKKREKNNLDESKPPLMQVKIIVEKVVTEIRRCNQFSLTRAARMELS
jgi:hypothetical protein